MAAGGPDVHIDMIEMLPTPWGLVRSGVAPDHPKIKSVSRTFEKTAADPRFRFFGNIAVGQDVSADDLAQRYAKASAHKGVAYYVVAASTIRMWKETI